MRIHLVEKVAPHVFRVNGRFEPDRRTDAPATWEQSGGVGYVDTERLRVYHPAVPVRQGILPK